LRFVVISPKVRGKILVYVRAGAKVRQAALAAGMEPDQVNRWLHQIENGFGTRAGKRFWNQVLQARAQAIVTGLARLHKEKPVEWFKERKKQLKSGAIGQRRSGPPPTKVTQQSIEDFISRLWKLLAPFPEARRHVARGLGLAEDAEAKQPSPPQ